MREPVHFRGAILNSGFPTIQATSVDSIPQMRQNFLVQLFTIQITWNKFMLDNAFPIKKDNQLQLEI
jgi:hypothetical protein